MSASPIRSIRLRLVVVGVLAITALGGIFAAKEAKAGYYQMVLCSANVGSNAFAIATNTTSPQNPGGIFQVENYCGPAPFPAGGSAFIRIVENQLNGNAGNTAYASASWTAPAYVSIKAAGGYTRQPDTFNDGWRARFWAEGVDGSGPHNILMQGRGVGNGGPGAINWESTGAFASHLWPFGGWSHYRRFIYEMTCVRPAGCSRVGFNATDANTFVLTLEDMFTPQIWLTNTSSFMAGQWVRGSQTSTHAWNELGSGIRAERVYIDGSERWGIDYIAAGQCNRDAWAGVGEFGRDFNVCPSATNVGRSFAVNTATLPDGPHTLTACIQDFGQWQGIGGTGGQTCTSGTVRTDNTAPPPPAELHVVTPNPARYSNRLAATFSLPANQGSPITRFHYDVVDAEGKVVVGERIVAATNPGELKDVTGPDKVGAYRLRVWLEDAVGFRGPPALAPLPRDTVPPAAPQGIAVTPPTTSRAEAGFDVSWSNIVDTGSPISGVRYQVLDSAGTVVVPTQAIDAENVHQIADLQTPGNGGRYALRIWLVDAEGNVGAPATAPLSYSCVRSPISGGQQLAASFNGASDLLVAQGQGATVTGGLRGSTGPVGGAPLCVFSRVVTDTEREFLGLAVTAPDGSYRFALGAGASRKVDVVYRPDSREISSSALLRTQVRPTLLTRNAIVRNRTFAHFQGEIPGPHNNQVVIVLQVRSGKGWLAFRRYRTRDNGRYSLRYHFRRTSRPTTYEMRAQVRETAGYPYVQGNSAPLRLRVVPGKRCKKGKTRCRAGRKCKKGYVKKKGKCVKHKKKAKHRKHAAGGRS